MTALLAKLEAKYKKKADVMVAAAKKTPEKVRPYMVNAAPVVAAMFTLFEMVLPFYVMLYKYALKAYKWLEPYHPEDMASVFFGLFTAFFGGEFPALITAVEAYRQMGFDATWAALKVLYADFERVQRASEKDDAVDADGDGVPDVDQIDSSELVERKLTLFLREVDPESLSDALQAITTGWVSVIAALRIKFARAVTLGAAIGDVLRKPLQRCLGPFLKKVVPEDYHKWILPGISYACKFVAVTVAWTIQSVISAFHSAVRGGAVAAKGTLHYLNKYGFVAVNADDTYLDEVVGYAIALLAFLVQFYTGFRLPFPFNVLLFPLRVLETIVVWTIMD